MSDAVTVTLRSPLELPLEAECLRADRVATLSEREIAALPVWLGGRPMKLGELFAVRGAHAARLRLEGDLSLAEGIGSEMAGGELVVEGHAGVGVGTGMSGGTIDVRGDCGDRVGAAAPGAARGMTGGEIVVRGSAGAEAGAGMRRGLLVIGGDAGESAGRGMIAGTVCVCGAAGRGAGRWIKRGTIVALGPIARPATFRYACTYRPPHLRLTFNYLRARYGLALADGFVTGRYHRYAGDMAELGRGEILQWAGDETTPGSA